MYKIYLTRKNGKNETYEKENIYEVLEFLDTLNDDVISTVAIKRLNESEE